MATDIYTTSLAEVLREIDGVLYRMLRLKLKNVKGKFYHQSSELKINAKDSPNEALAYSFQISGNQKELDAYFMTDAFSDFGSEAVIEFQENGLTREITEFDPGDVIELPPNLASLDYQDADNDWLANH